MLQIKGKLQCWEQNRAGVFFLYLSWRYKEGLMVLFLLTCFIKRAVSVGLKKNQSCETKSSSISNIKVGWTWVCLWWNLLLNPLELNRKETTGKKICQLHELGRRIMYWSEEVQGKFVAVALKDRRKTICEKKTRSQKSNYSKAFSPNDSPDSLNHVKKILCVYVKKKK